MSDTANIPILILDNITKAFGETKALGGVSFDLHAGEVHSICGENGAGKSTLIKVLSGAIQPDGGRILLADKTLSGLTPATAMDYGIATIYQENALFGNLSVAENMFIGAEPRLRGGIVDRSSIDQRAQQILSNLGADIDPSAQLGNLGGAQQKIVEIARAFRQKAKVLVMDEPSSSFGHHEVELLFRAVREVAKTGTAVIFISHHLDEVFELSDRVTVIRDGKSISSHMVQDIDEANLINKMVGRDITQVYHHTPSYSEETVLCTKDLSGSGVRQVSINLRKGEVVGIAGLVGSGRTELLNLIFGSARPDQGEIELQGRRVEIQSPAKAVNNRLCLITEDRKINGLCLGQSYLDNFLLPSIARYARPFMNWKKAANAATQFAEKLAMTIGSLAQPVGTLSGGNQQKVIIAKWMNTEPEIFLFDEPTRGIDVGAKEEIYIEIQKLIEAGKSILMVSSELPEIIGLSDRIYVMKDGAIADELIAPGISERQILAAAL